ncbi:hypothetical protein PPL_02910 [Heterostelium album PN500]|uniref:Uncharacterized protein n=1 Tax=Heterostelium pallidum (strain ATCC 26659 / Pp 5 / PN500) TaxID=670386 RepID=D3B3E3_HETP5|nr:hypothetical protein PPL_02910 [Heterostelium album PN500]EFA83841.1 hypothetical protein PPL_02910 [Heterostelium album PN500]|eukprot:XP_020435958.1 hypothetical protein PPL_02910 [Heterostelium album PN500]
MDIDSNDIVAKQTKRKDYRNDDCTNDMDIVTEKKQKIDVLDQIKLAVQLCFENTKKEKAAQQEEVYSQLFKRSIDAHSENGETIDGVFFMLESHAKTTNTITVGSIPFNVTIDIYINILKSLIDETTLVVDITKPIANIQLWQCISYQSKISLLYRSMELIGKYPILQTSLIPLVIQLYNQYNNEISEYRDLLRNIIASYIQSDSYSLQMVFISIISQIIKNNPSAYQYVDDITSSLTEMVQHSLETDGYESLELLKQFIIVITRCDIDSPELVVSLVDTLLKYPLNDEESFDRLKIFIFDMLTSQTLETKSVVLFNDTVSTFLNTKENLTTPKAIQLLQEYYRLMFVWASYIPENFDIEAWKLTSGDLESSDKQKSSLSSLDNIGAYGDAVLLYQEFIKYWNNAMLPCNQDQWQLIMNVSQIFLIIYEHVHNLVGPNVYKQILKVFKDTTYPPIIKFNFVALMSQMMNDNRNDDEMSELFLDAMLSENVVEVVVQSRLLKAISDAFADRRPEVLEMYKPRLFQYIEPYFKWDQHPDNIEGAISVLTGIIDIIPDNDEKVFFLRDQYLPLFLKLLEHSFSNNNNNNDNNNNNIHGSNIKGRVIEAISMLSLSLKNDSSFDVYVLKTLDLFSNEDISVDTRFSDFYLRALVRFAQRLESRFEPYLPLTIRHIMKILTYDLDPANHVKVRDINIGVESTSGAGMVHSFGDQSLLGYSQYMELHCIITSRLEKSIQIEPHPDIEQIKHGLSTTVLSD